VGYFKRKGIAGGERLHKSPPPAAAKKERRAPLLLRG